MTIDIYGEKVAEASALIREFAKVDYFHYFARDPESSLEAFIALLDQAEEKGRQSQAARIAELGRALEAAHDEIAQVRADASRAAPSAPAVEQQPVAWLSEQWGPSSDRMNPDGEWQTVTTTSNPTGWDGFRNPRPLVFASAQAADTDKVREAAFADTSEVPYLIFYDDQDKPTETVIGHDRAAYRFQQISGNWNAHLYVKIASNSRDCKWPNAKLATDMAAQAPVREVPEGWIACADQMPESGKRVIFAWTNKLGKHRTSIGQWNKRWDQVANNSDEDACEYDEDKDEYFLLEGWQEWGWELEFSAYVEDTVTHWMPLPAAPVQQEGASNA